MPTNSPTSTEQVIERARILVAQSTRVSPDIEREEKGDGEERYVVRGVPCGFPVAKFGDHHDAELFVFASTQLIQLLGYRNTPVDSEVERVRDAIWREDHYDPRLCGHGGEAGLTTCAYCEPHDDDTPVPWPADKERAERQARAAIASLPPKPVDGEVAELVERLLNLHERMLDAVRKQRPYPVKLHCGDSDTDAVMRAVLALSRNTEPMVTDAMLVAGARAAADRHIECGSYGNIEAIYLAMVSAGEKGTDDASRQ